MKARYLSWQFIDLLPSYTRTTFKIVFLIACLTIVISLVYYPRLQPVIPMFYSLASDSQQLVDKKWLFLFPSFSIVIASLHCMLVISLAKIQVTAAKLFALTTAVIEVILLLIFLRIILIIS